MGKSFKTFLLVSSVVTGGMIAVSAASHAQEKASFNEAQTKEIEGIIQNYLLNNPKIVMDAAEAYRIKMELEQQEKAKTAITDNMAKLTSAEAPSIGPEDASVTVIEFFDYNCGYFKRALPDVRKAVEVDKDVRFVFKEFPILGPTSNTAAQWALAAHKQGKYFEYHSALMEFRGPKEEEQLAKIAGDLGLDVDQMKKDAAAPEVQAMLDDDIALAQEIGFTGTPAFIIEGTLFGGYLGEEGLLDAIKEARNPEEKDG